MNRLTALTLALVPAAALAVGAQQMATQEVKIVTSADGPGPIGINGQQAQPMGRGTGVIFGQVTDAESNRPVAGALVTLSIPGAQPIRVMADGNGRFGFRDLPAGRFSLNTARPGWVDGSYGRTRPAGPSQPIALANGDKVSGVTVPMWRYAAITGALVDDAGDPIVNRTVRVLKRTTVGGKQRYVLGAQDSTDDRGIYRIGMLEPGEYIVSVPMDSGGDFVEMPAMAAMAAKEVAMVRATANAGGGGGGGAMMISDTGSGGIGMTEDGHTLVYPTIFYPTSTTAAKATVITVASGEERTAIDFNLKAVPTSKVSGTVMGPEGPSGNLQVTLVPAEADELATAIDTLVAFADNQGKFTFSSVTPGQYLLRTIRTPRMAMGPMETQTVTQGGNVMVFRTASASGSAPLPTDPTLWAEMSVSVGGRDLTELTVGLRPGVKVSGMVQFSGTAERPAGDRLPSIGLNLEPAEQRPGLSGGRGRIDPSGQFTTVGVPPGKYFIRVNGAPQGWNFLSAMVNGRDASVTPIDLEGNDVNGVTLAFTDQPSELSGEVSAEGAALDSYSVLVFPTDTAAWTGYGSQSRRFTSTRVGKDGKFRLMNLPAGDYFVIAIQDKRAGDWQNPKMLESLSTEASRVRVRDGDHVTQMLKGAR